MPYHLFAAFFCLLFAASPAFTPIQWASARGEILNLMPKSFSGHLLRSYALPKILTIGVTSNRMVPQFTANSDNTISVGYWCVEADGKTAGDAVIVNNCNGGPTQHWNWISEGHGRSMIQLKGTNLCLNVNDKEGSLIGAAVQLQTCGSESSSSWLYVGPRSIPMEVASSGSDVRHAAIVFASMILFGVLAISAWLWRWRAKTLAIPVSQYSMPLPANQGGVSLIEPWRANQNWGEESGADSHFPMAPQLAEPIYASAARSGDVRMEAIADLQDLASERQSRPFEATGFWDAAGRFRPCDFASVFERHTITETAFAGVPLADEAPATRARVLTALARAVDVELHPDAEFENAEAGLCVNGKARGQHMAPYDWLRNERRVACKSSQLKWHAHCERWQFHFQHVKLGGESNDAAFDELLLAAYTPRGIYLYRHDGRLGVTTNGKETVATGRQIKVYGPCGQTDWKAALDDTLLPKLEDRGCEYLALVPFDDPHF